MTLFDEMYTKYNDAFIKTGSYPEKVHITDEAFYSLMQDEVKYFGQYVIAPYKNTILGIHYERKRDTDLQFVDENGVRNLPFAFDYCDDIKNGVAFGYVFRDGRVVKAVVRRLHPINLLDMDVVK